MSIASNNGSSPTAAAPLPSIRFSLMACVPLVVAQGTRQGAIGARMEAYFFSTPQKTGMVVGRMPSILARRALRVRYWPALI